MLRKHVTTGLIFEDDVDWDITIKDQLVEIAKGSKYVLGNQGESESAYGNDWDLLFLGICQLSLSEVCPS